MVLKINKLINYFVRLKTFQNYQFNESFDKSYYYHPEILIAEMREISENEMY